MYLHWEFGDKNQCFCLEFHLNSNIGRKKYAWEPNIPVLRRVKKAWVGLPTRTPSLQNPTRAKEEEPTWEQWHKTSGSAGACAISAQYLPSCFYSAVPAEIQPSPGLWCPLCRCTAENKTPLTYAAGSRGSELRDWAERLCQPCLDNAGVFGGGASARIQLDNKGTGWESSYIQGQTVSKSSTGVTQNSRPLSFQHKCSIYSALSLLQPLRLSFPARDRTASYIYDLQLRTCHLNILFSFSFTCT